MSLKQKTEIARLKAINKEILSCLEVLANFGMDKQFGYVVDNLGSKITFKDCERARDWNRPNKKENT